jgi:hypothetical protein
LVLAGDYVIAWSGHPELSSASLILAVALAIAGALLTFRYWWGLLVALAYVPLLYVGLGFLQLTVGCAIIGRYACI